MILDKSIASQLTHIKAIFNRDVILGRDDFLDYVLFYMLNDLDEIFQDMIGSRYFMENGSVKKVDMAFLESVIATFPEIKCDQIVRKIAAKKLSRTLASQIDF
jgi:hypothetical protein